MHGSQVKSRHSAVNFFQYCMYYRGDKSKRSHSEKCGRVGRGLQLKLQQYYSEDLGHVYLLDEKFF